MISFPCFSFFSFYTKKKKIMWLIVSPSNAWPARRRLRATPPVSGRCSYVTHSPEPDGGALMSVVVCSFCTCRSCVCSSSAHTLRWATVSLLALISMYPPGRHSHWLDWGACQSNALYDRVDLRVNHRQAEGRVVFFSSFPRLSVVIFSAFVAVTECSRCGGDDAPRRAAFIFILDLAFVAKFSKSLVSAASA